MSNSLISLGNTFKSKFHPIQTTSDGFFWKGASITRWESHQMMMLVDFYRCLFSDSSSIISCRYRANDFANGKKWRNFYSCFRIWDVFDGMWLTVRHLLGHFMSESIYKIVLSRFLEYCFFSLSENNDVIACNDKKR